MWVKVGAHRSRDIVAGIKEFIVPVTDKEASTKCCTDSDLIKQILCGGVEEVQRGVTGTSRSSGSLQVKKCREAKACVQEERRPR